MRSFFLAVLFCLAHTAPTLAQSNNTFLKVVTNFNRGYTICPSGDGNLYVVGVVVGRTALLKIAPNGDIISTRFLHFGTGNLDNISEIIVDSDGMIAGCGTQGTEDLRRGFVFRYNPFTSSVLWTKTLNDEIATLSGLLEKRPGGHYLAYGEVFYEEMSVSVNSDALVLQIDRNTGAPLSPLTKHYHLGKNESFNAIVAHDSTLYALGRAINGMSVFTDLFVRSALTRLDTASGAPLWTRLSGAPLTAPAHLRGRDLIVDGDALIATYTGNTSDPSLSTTTFFLQKHRLDGTIEWRRKYDLPEWSNEVAEELIRVPDGYVLYGRASNAAGGSLFVLKTNKQGQPLWANKLHYGINDGFGQTESQQGQIIALGNNLFFTATTEQANGTSRMLLVKANANGSLGDSCSYWTPTPVVMSVPTGLPDAPVMLQVNTNVMPLVDAPHPAVVPVTANVQTICQMEQTFICADTLNLGPNVVLCHDSTVVFRAAGSGLVSYLWQDGSTDSTYSTNLPDVYWVEVTDTCGQKQRDSVLLTFSLLADMRFPNDSVCSGESLTYTSAGFDSYAWAPTAGLSCDTCATVTITPTATTTYTLLAQNAAGCVLTDTFTLVINLVADARLADTTICPGESLTYTVSDFDSYAWTPATGLSCDTCATVILTPTATTTYTLLAQNTAGCVLADTFIIVVNLVANSSSADTTICPGESLTYAVPGFDFYLWAPATGLNCDTCATVVIAPTATTTYTLLAQNADGCVATDTFTVTVSTVADIQLVDNTICPGESMTYAVPGFDSYSWTPATGLNCDTCATVVIAPTATTTYTLLAQNADGCVATDTFIMTVSTVVDIQLADTTICPGESLTYAASGFVTYSWTPTTGLDCDTCAMATITPINTTTYTLSAQNADGCLETDTFTVTVSLVPNIHFADTTICSGESVIYADSGFDSYIWTPATGLSCSPCATVVITPTSSTTYTLLAQNTDGCVQTDTFIVTVSPLLTRTEVIEFLPGDTVTLGGLSYTQPGTVMLALPATIGCDTLVRYTLRFQTDVVITCTDEVVVTIPVGTTQAIVDFTLPTAVTNCPGGALTFLRLNSPPGSNLFPIGTTKVCYRVTDACGNSDTCCFDVRVMVLMPPCAVRTNGCLRYELFPIKLDSVGNRRYTIRVVNNCAEALLYTAFEVPGSVVALSPVEASIFTAASGRTYEVRNPNFSPFYSIRFKAQPATLLQLGAADLFTYTLPQQSMPSYINVTSRLQNGQFYPAVLNTFECPVQPYPNFSPGSGSERLANGSVLLFPNPTIGTLFVDLSAWVGQTVQLRIINAQGQLQQTQTVVASEVPQTVGLLFVPANGLYSLEVYSADGQRAVQVFVVQR